MTQIYSKVKRRSGKNCQAMFSFQRPPSVVRKKYLEEVLGSLLANSTSGRELARDCKTLDPWGTAARRSDHIVELKTSAKYKQKELTHAHTLKSQKQTKMTRTLEQQDRDERQNRHAQIYTPTNYPYTRAHA